MVFETMATEEVAPVMRDVRPIDEAQFRLIWGWMEREMLGGDGGGGS